MLAAGFLILFTIVIASNLVGINKIRSNFETFESTSVFAAKIDSIKNNINLIRQHVLSFAFTGNEAAAIQARELGKELRQQIRQVIAESEDDEIDYHLEKMNSHLNSYLENFETVIVERKLRNELVQQIVQESKNIEQLLDEMNASNAYTVDTVDAENIRRNVLRAEISALEFVDDPDATQVREVQEQLKQATSAFNSTMQGDELNEKELQLVAMLGHFEQDFIRVVQATRGYLYLVNVVMTGEAVEFSYQSERINQVSNHRLEQSARLSSSNTALASNIALASAIGAIVISMLVSVTLVRMLVLPIGRITNTLTALSRDEKIDQIPGMERRDEIGDMARAANVFREKNRQTEVLLEETRMLAKKLDIQAKQLAQSNEELDSFAYVASHDLKSPLRAIDNLSKWIYADAKDVLPEDSRENLQEMRVRVKRMERLLDDLLTYSRAKQDSGNVEEIDTAQIVWQSQQLIDWPADMTLCIDNELPTIHSFRLPLERIFQNLLTNATKYRVDRDAKVVVSCTDLGDSYQFSVADNGPGIAPKFHSKIFEMFRRLHSQSEVDGSGMGLALVKRLVEAMGGNIRVESEVDHGANFIFTVPKNTRDQRTNSEAGLALGASMD